MTEGNKDEVKGVISLKDLVLHLDAPDFNLADIVDRKSTRLNSSHSDRSRMPSSA